MKKKRERKLPVGMYADVGLFGDRVRYKSPLTGRLRSVPKKYHDRLDDLASALSGEAMRRLIDLLGADAYPNGQVHGDLVHTRLHIARNRMPLPPPVEQVYFLLSGDEIVYIGRTDRLQARLAKHIVDGRKFDSYYAFTPALPAEIVETYYILKFEPPGNVARSGLSPAMRKKLLKKAPGKRRSGG